MKARGREARMATVESLTDLSSIGAANSRNHAETIDDRILQKRYVVGGYSCWVGRHRPSRHGNRRKPPLATRWTKDVSPDNALPEYPRPQMVRETWTNLNGLWEYAIRPAAEDAAGEMGRRDPRAVRRRVGAERREEAGARRTSGCGIAARSTRPALPTAAGCCCTSAPSIGSAPSGSTARKSASTRAATIRSRSTSPTRSKRRRRTSWSSPCGIRPTRATSRAASRCSSRDGIWYTAVTGIWQTVWLEPVPAAHIESLKIVPDVDRSVVTVTVDGAERRQRARATVSSTDGEQVGDGRRRRRRADRARRSPTPKLWSPDQPHLYDLHVELLGRRRSRRRGRQLLRHAQDRSQQGPTGVNRLLLNNKPLFQYGPLDQGWWPDGLYTPPTDEALKYDIEMTKKLGFNMVRKHVKVEPARWYYWCDKLGLLVWQDMPSGNVDEDDAESKANFRRELQGDDRRAAQSSVDRDVGAVQRRLGPARHGARSSTWIEGVRPDAAGERGQRLARPRQRRRLATCTATRARACGPSKTKRVGVLGEFGGLGLPLAGHTWQDEKNWGYVSYDNAEELTDAYVELARPRCGR